MTEQKEQDPATVAFRRRTNWIAHDLERLAQRVGDEPRCDGLTDFDIVIVGSGYGGAVAAHRLAGRLRKCDKAPLRICVLERGREYLPGAFPERFADLPGHVRFSSGGPGGARGEREGLFDMRLGPDISVLVANGVGGGSLINAGVMELPTECVQPAAARGRVWG